MEHLRPGSFKKIEIEDWYPDAFIHYLCSICLGQGVRQISKLAGVSPSTISRQLSKLEDRREDTNFDQWMSHFESVFLETPPLNRPSSIPEFKTMIIEEQNEKISEAKLQVESRRILRRLSERNAFMLLAPELPNAAIFREAADGSLQRLAVTSRIVGEEFLLRDWIEGRTGQKIGRYHITSRGSAALKRLLQRERAQKESSELLPVNEYAFQHAEFVHKNIAHEEQTKRFHVNVSESPLAILSRKRDKDGHPYLTPRQIAAGERIREDFEVSQIGPRVTQNWDRFLTASNRGQFHEVVGLSDGAEAARKRLQEALCELGDGLSDIAFRCCCYLEGLETIERKLGWSARSGKVVLRIALERLAEFYQIPERRRHND